MAAVTTSAIGVGLGAYQMIDGMNKSKDPGYTRQPLENAFKDVPISTVGADFAREETGRNNASMVEAVRGGGAQGIYSSLPKIVENNNNENRKIQIDLDNQVNKRNYAAAGDEVAIRDIKENRDTQNIAAISSRVQKGNQDMWSGMMGIGKSVMYGAGNIDFGLTDDSGNSGSYLEQQQKRLNKSLSK